jgi:hypothetical protein
MRVSFRSKKNSSTTAVLARGRSVTVTMEIATDPPPATAPLSTSDSSSSSSSASSSSLSSLRDRFADDGYLWMKEALPRDVVNAWSDQFSSLLDDTFVALNERQHVTAPCHQVTGDNDGANNIYTLGLGARHGFREIVMRSPGRYEIAIAQDRSTAIYDTIQQYLPLVPDLLRQPQHHTIPLTWDDVKLQNMSIVTSIPGATDQAWHADGSHVSLIDHLPCHCLNIFIPLNIDLTMEVGPTQLRPHSHYYTRGNMLAGQMLLNQAKRTLRPVIAPLLQRTDCLIFDYRILHRGLAHSNANQSQRILLNVTVSLPWFKDVVNFPKRSLYDNSDAVVDDVDDETATKVHDDKDGGADET